MADHFPPPADPVGEALHFLRMNGIFYTRSEFSAPWALALPPIDGSLMLHVLISGRCRLEVAGTPPRLLHSGDFALVPHGEGHHLSSAPGLPAVNLFDLPREQVSERYEILRHGGGGEAASMICVAVKFDHPAARQLVTLLPRMIVIDAKSSPRTAWSERILQVMAEEAGAMLPGGETIITRLADLLVIQAIRCWISDAPAAQLGWLGALRDDLIGRAVLLIHRDPGRAWTVASLASEVGMSRSAFSARFSALVGEPPLRYLTRWRMHMALARLREEDATVGELAGHLGYESEAAFSRAFKRFAGVAPGASRHRAPDAPLRVMN